MPGLVGALIVMLAIKLAEGHGSIEFEARSGGIIVVTLAYLVASWAGGTLLALLLAGVEPPAGFSSAIAYGLTLQFVSTLLALVLACFLVPGVHIRRFTGLAFAAALIVAINYFVIGAMTGI